MPDVMGPEDDVRLHVSSQPRSSRVRDGEFDSAWV